MKKILYIASSLLITAAFASCSADKDLPGQGKEVSISLTAGIEEAKTTRTDITDPSNPKWTEGDAMGIILVSNNTIVAAGNNKPLYSTLIDDGETARFSNYITLPYGNYTIYGYHPHGSATTTDVTAAKVVVPAIQHPTATSFDPAADVMVMYPVNHSHDGASSIVRNGLHFKRTLGMVKFLIDGSALGDEAIDELTFTTDDASLLLAGTGNFNLKNASFVGFDADAVTSITARPSVDVFANGTDAIIITMPAVTFPAGATLTVTGETESYAFTKSLTLDADIVLETAGIHTMNISLEAEDVTDNEPGGDDEEATQFVRAVLGHFNNAEELPNLGINFDTDMSDDYGQSSVEFQPYFTLDPALLDMTPSIEILDIPEGTYAINDSNDPQTVSSAWTVMYDLGGLYRTLSGGTITVEGDHTDYHITFTVIHNAGTFEAEYNGPLNIANPNYDGSTPPVEATQFVRGVAADYYEDGVTISFDTDMDDDYGQGSVEFQPFFCFDLTPINAAPSVAILDLPEGTYTIDNSWSPLTVYSGSTMYDLGGLYRTISGGTVTVEGDHTDYHITFTVTHNAGTFVAEYNGPLDIANPNYDGSTPPVEATQFVRASAGNYYEDAVTLSFDTDTVDNNLGAGGGFEFQPYVYFALTPINAAPSVEILDIPEGTYTIDSSGSPQTVSSLEYWSVLYDNSTWRVPSGGTITVEGDHTDYHITFNVIHNAGTFVAEYNGPLDIANPNYVATRR